MRHIYAQEDLSRFLPFIEDLVSITFKTYNV